MELSNPYNADHEPKNNKNTALLVANKDAVLEANVATMFRVCCEI